MPGLRNFSPGYQWARRNLLPTPAAAAAWQFQEKLEQSQWLSPSQHLANQMHVLRALLHHAEAEVPYHRDAFRAAGFDASAALSPATWEQVPVLTRETLQAEKDALTARRYPKEHGEAIPVTSSGSTGRPIDAFATGLTGTWYRTLTLRSFLWSLKRLDIGIAAIRRQKRGEADFPDGVSWPAWDDDLTVPVKSGRRSALTVATTTQQQVDWLRRVQPDVLMVYPSVLGALLDEVAGGSLSVPRVQRILTFSETVDDDLRTETKRLLGAEIFDSYSANETGIIALQCPDGRGYHVQSESVLVEVLDAAGAPCKPGESGRVVITLLHNYALPLIRYDIGDVATVGHPCRCGRGLMPLSRIVGRRRTLMVGPGGNRIRPVLGWRQMKEIAPIAQGQFVQHAIDRLEMRLVPRRPLTAEEEEGIRRHLRSRMPQYTEIAMTYLDEIPRSESGKFDDFICLVK